MGSPSYSFGILVADELWLMLAYSAPSGVDILDTAKAVLSRPAAQQPSICPAGAALSTKQLHPAMWNQGIPICLYCVFAGTGR